MKKPIISLLLVLSLLSNIISKRLSMFAETSLISTSFEDGDITMFTKRGDYDASKLTLKKMEEKLVIIIYG